MTSLEIISLVYGGLLIVMGLALLLRGTYMGKILAHMAEEPSELFSFGVLTTIMGLVVLGIAGFSITWTGTLWLLPLLGWLSLLKGVILTLFPDVFKPLYKSFYKSGGMIMFAGLVAVVIGAWILWVR
jgi:hypothetical protein